MTALPRRNLQAAIYLWNITMVTATPESCCTHNTGRLGTHTHTRTLTHICQLTHITFMATCKLTHMHAYTYTCIHNVARLRTCKLTHMHAYARRHTHAHTHAHTDTYTHAHTLAHTHAHMNASKHAHMHKRKPRWDQTIPLLQSWGSRM